MKSTTEKVAFVVAMLIITFDILLVVGGCVLIGKLINYSKDAITGEKFVEIMEKNDFKVTETKDSFLGPYISLKKGYVAEKDDYKVEFYTFKDESSAKEYFSLTKSKIDSNVSSTRVDFSGKNFQMYTAESSGKYKYLERIDKTVLVINVDKEYKDEVKDVVDELGY